jgi:SIT4-associating protein SAP185/190
MHQKNNAAAAAAAAALSSTTDGAKENGDLNSEDRKDSGEPSPLRNPFGDDADEIDSDDGDEDEDDEMGGEGVGSSWGMAGRGSWWRNVVMKGSSSQDKDDSDEEVQDEEDDEEFGDFAMPEVDKGPGPNVVRPTAVHPPTGGSGAQGHKSGLGSLWPFGTQSSAGSDEKTGDASSPTSSPCSQPGDSAPASEKRTESKGDAAGAENPGVSRTVEARQRTSLDDLDDEVMV